jgi:hypothetical protein
MESSRLLELLYGSLRIFTEPLHKMSLPTGRTLVFSCYL